MQIVDFTDVAQATRRSMLANKGKNTKPELVVRRLVHSMGYRYRLHRRDLPGTPDLVFGLRKKVIFVHGCFWHRHNCTERSVPKTRTDYWQAKFRRNAERDTADQEGLRVLGWAYLVVWECETKRTAELRDRIRAFLEG